MKKTLAFFTTVALAFAILSPIAAQSSGKLVPVRVGHLPNVGQSLYYVALANGYFKDEGLDVQLTPIAAGADIFNGLASGKFDFASAGTAAPLNFIANGAPFVIVGGLMGEGSVFQVRADEAKSANIKTLQDFKGKKVATVRLGTGDIVVRGALAKAGILDKVEFVEFKSVVDSLLALKTGRVDIALTWPPFSDQAEIDGYARSVAWTGQWFPHHTCCRLVTTESYLKQNPDVTVKFITALIKADNFFKAEPNKYAQIVADHLKVSVDTVIPTLIRDKTTYISAAPDKQAVLDFWEYMKAAGYTKSTFDVATHIDESYYNKALAGLNKVGKL